jgi:transcription elongation factor GreB
MGRWRAPRPESSPYITPDGYQALQDELKALWVRRADVVKALSAAAAEGDRSENAVFFGAWVSMQRDDGSRIEYRIVGADEADAAQDRISIDSPLARALLKKQVDDEITLTIEGRRENFMIERIRYD